MQRDICICINPFSNFVAQNGIEILCNRLGDKLKSEHNALTHKPQWSLQSYIQTTCHYQIAEFRILFRQHMFNEGFGLHAPLSIY